MTTKSNLSYCNYISFKPNSFCYSDSSVLSCASYVYLKFVALNFDFLGVASKCNAILELHLQEKRQCSVVRLLSVGEEVRSKAVKQFEALGNEGNRPGIGIKRTFNTSRKGQIIKKRVQRSLRVSMKKTVSESGILRPISTANGEAGGLCQVLQDQKIAAPDEWKSARTAAMM